MKTIRLHYDINTGKILGYYPCNLDYIQLPKPLIEITENQYAALLHNESKYLVQNKELVDISNTVDYRLAQTETYLLKASKIIAEKAKEAENWGVISIDNTYFNVHWKNYYQSLLDLLEKNSKSVCIRIYSIINDKYYLSYKKFSANNAKTFLQKALEAISMHCTQYIPEKQNAYIEELKVIKESKNSNGIVNFLNTIDYGYTLNEDLVTVPLEV